MADFLQRFLQFIQEKKLLEKGDHVLVAVSGGVDSVVLLDLLLRIKGKYRLLLEVVHLNHGIRAAESDEDQEFVGRLAARLKLPFHSKKVSVPEYSKFRKLSLEEAARELRYQFFDEMISRRDADKLALAHHADDQVETVISHFLRGSGVAGLAGMPAKRGVYIRPMLFASREDIENYAALRQLEFREDSSNFDLKYRRNRIRHELLPYLKNHFNAGISHSILRTQQTMAEIDEFLKSEAENAFAACLKKEKKNKIILEINHFLSYFNVIQKYIVYAALEKLQVKRFEVSAEKLERIIHLIQNRKHSTRVEINDKTDVFVDRSEIVFKKRKAEPLEFYPELGKLYDLPDDAGKLRLKIQNDQKIKFTDSPDVEFADWEKVTGRLRVRNWRHGDKFIPLNMTGHKKVSDFLTDLKVPLHERDEVVVLECDDGIIWVVGYRLDDRFKVTSETTQILKMEKISKAE